MQTELFEMGAPAENGPEIVPVKQNWLERKFLTLRLDQTIGLVLVLLVFYVISFSFGFEKGKHSVRNDQVVKKEMTPSASAPRPLPQNLIIYDESTVQNTPVAVVATVPVSGASVSKTAADANPVSAKVRPQGKYTIQHVIYTSKSAAEKEVETLNKKGHRAFILPSGKYMQVCLSGFSTKKEADQFLKQLRAERIVAQDAYVRNMPA